MKKLLVLLFTLSCGIQCFSQIKDADKKAELENQIKKQIICDDLEKDIKDVPFAAIRVFARSKIAAWLWKDGQDHSGRAEQIAVSAIDDLYKNKAEISPADFATFEAELFALLERYAKDVARRLREKHKINSVDQSGLIDSLLDQKDGDRLAADAAIRSLVNQSDANPELVSLIWRLQQRKSPEVLRLLNEILHAGETGRSRFTADTLFLMSRYFVEQDVPISVQRRFLKLVVDMSKRAARMPEADADGFFNLLSGLMSDISMKFAEIHEEAIIVQAVLRTRSSREYREAQERNDRIQSSSDKLSALISEAERADNNPVKYELYVRAGQLALERKKFAYSVDIVERSAEVDLSSSTIPETLRKGWRDQFRGDVAAKALQSDDPESAKYALRKATDSLTKVEILRKIANYYLGQNDPGSARDALDDALKLAGKAEPSARRTSSLISLLATVQKIDAAQVFELNKLIAKSINSMPSLKVEDKPHTEAYKNYVTSAMIVNWSLLPALTRLVKVNKGGASDLTDRIDKKEIKLIATYSLLIDSIHQSTSQKTDQ